MAVDAGTAQAYLDIDISQYLANLDKAISKTKSTQNQIEATGTKVESVGKKIESVGSTLTKGVTTPIVGLGVAAVKTAATFESSMSTVSAISGATGNELDQLSTKAREMGAKTKFSASEAAEAFKYMAMAGWKTDDMLNSIEGVMNLAAASGENLGTVSDIVTDAMTAFGLAADGATDGIANATHFADVLAAASNSANTNVSMLGESFKFVAPVAGSLGYTVEDTSIALGLMANSGIKASQAGTSLRGALSRMIKPTKDSAAVMKEYGISMFNADGSSKSLMEVMQNLRDVFSDNDISIQNADGSLKTYEELMQEATDGTMNLSDQQKLLALSTLFGTESLSGMLAIINTSGTDFDILTNAINNADGTAQKMSDTMQNNLSGKLIILKSALEELAISFGNLLIPGIEKAISFIQGLVDKLNSMDDSQRQTIIRILEVAAVVGPVILVIGKLTSGVGKLITGIGKVAGVFGKFSSAASSAAGPAASAASGVGKLATSALNLLAAGAGILMAAGGLALLANSAIQIASAGWPAAAALAGLVAALALLAVGAAAIGPALTAGAVGLVAFGAAIALVGVGILAASAGVSLLATQLPTIAANGSAAGSALVALSSGLLAFAGPAAVAGAALVVVAAGLTTVGAGALVASAGVLALGAAAIVLGAGIVVAGAGLTLCGASMSVIGSSASAATSGLTGLAAAATSAFIPFVAGSASCVTLTASVVALTAVVVVLSANFALTAASCALFLAALVGVQASMLSIESSAKTSSEALSSMVSSIDTVSSGLTGLSSAVSSTLEAVVQAFTQTEPEAKTQATVLANGIVYGFQTGMNRLPSVVNSAVAPVKTLGSQAYSWGADIASGIARGLESKKGDIKAQVDDIAGYIHANLHFSKPDEGPLRDYETWMPDFVHGLAMGIYKSAPELKAASQYLAESLTTVSSTDFDSSPVDNYSISIINLIGLYKELLVTVKELYTVSKSLYSNTDMEMLYRTPQMVSSRRESSEEQPNNKEQPTGDVYNFYSPKQIDEVEAARQLKKVKRQLSEGF